MVIAVQNITLSSSRDIPVNKPVLSQFNGRRMKAGVTIEDLAVSITPRDDLLVDLRKERRGMEPTGL